MKGMVERLCKKKHPAQTILSPPYCRINLDVRRVKKYIRQSGDAIHPMTSINSCSRQNNVI